MKQNTYFVIDDSKFARTVVKNIFNKLGYEFKGEAQSYKDALAQIQRLKQAREELAYVTLDITMPEIHGDELIPIILEVYPDAKIIMTTSVADKGTVTRCIAAGSKGYILKPVTEEKVLEAMNIITINSLLKKKGIDPNS